MRKPRPIARLDEITIVREKETAIIQYKDPAYGTTYFQIGPQIEPMTDQSILDLYNDCLKAQAELSTNNPYVATELPIGSPQIEFREECDQWVSKGHVLRCLVDTAEEVREPVIVVDDKELTWHEFGKMICSFSGWGMRIEFTPEDAIHRRPKLEVKEPYP